MRKGKDHKLSPFLYLLFLYYKIVDFLYGIDN
jgi:hypothetical protein